MDVYLEHLVKQKPTTKSKLIKASIILGTILLILLMYVLSLIIPAVDVIFLAIIAAGVYGAWYLMTSQNVEFEYIVTNGEMDIDKVIAQRKRKRQITIKFRDIEIMAPAYGEHKREGENRSVETTIDAAVSSLEKDTYFIITRTEKKGLTKILFTPDERIIKSAQSVAPRKVFTA